MAYLEVAQGRFKLDPGVRARADGLRAWDAADELTLNHLASVDLALRDVRSETSTEPPSVLVVNDRCGALAVALVGAVAPHGGRVVSWGDSYLSHRLTESNLVANGHQTDSVRLCVSVTGDDLPVAPNGFDAVIIKIPKSLDQLRHQLAVIAPHLNARMKVVGAGMTRHVHTATTDAFAQIIGPVHTSHATKKARLIHSQRDAAVNSAPQVRPLVVAADSSDPGFAAWPGVFSAQHLDHGSRLLLSAIADRVPAIDLLLEEAASDGAGNDTTNVVDLGCGTGVLGTAVSQRCRSARLAFVDDSFAAAASAEATFRLAHDDQRSATFLAGDVLDDLDQPAPWTPGQLALVLCNPPFHQAGARSTATAVEMFRQAHHHLRPSGELWVVGNRHLGYHTALRKIFGNVEVLTSTPTFVALRSRR